VFHVQYTVIPLRFANICQIFNIFLLHNTKNPSYKIVQYAKFTHFSSLERIERYRKLCTSEDETLNLYECNLKISMTFYPLLSLIETFLRNSIDNALSEKFGPNWFKDEQKASGFLGKAEITAIQIATKKAEKTGRRFTKPQTQIDAIRGAIKKLERKNGNLKRNNKPQFKITRGKIIAELSFGFWTQFYRKSEHKATGGVAVNKCFSFRPKGINFNEINGLLYEVRTLRNRIYHNEPICFNGNSIDFTEVLQTRDRIYELLSWMDRDIANYVAKFDTIEDEVSCWNKR